MGEQRPKSLGILGGARNENVAYSLTLREFQLGKFTLLALLAHLES